MKVHSQADAQRGVRFQFQESLQDIRIHFIHGVVGEDFLLAHPAADAYQAGRETPAGEGVRRDTGFLSQLDLADVGLIDFGPDHQLGSVGDAQDGAAEGFIGNRLSGIHKALDYDAVDRRPYEGVIEVILCGPQAGVGQLHVGARRRHVFGTRRSHDQVISLTG